MTLELLREQYAFELNRKQQLESSLTLPVAVLTGLGGVGFSYARSFSYGYNLKTYVFLVALIGAAISFVSVFYYLIRATHRFMYEVIPSSLELLTYYEQACDYHESAGIRSRADKDFELKMKHAYANASTKNMQNNISKAGYLYRAYMGLVMGTVFLAICAGPYLANELTRPSPVQRIELVNEGQLKKMGRTHA